MHEQSKSAKRRFYDGAFLSRYFVGEGIDIGGAPDPLGQYMSIFPMMRSCRVWDLADGDAQYMAGVLDSSFDFIHSSHCLEHMVDPRVALRNWLRILRPGGYLIITVPDEDLYEQGIWPSQYNSDHKWSFTIHKSKSSMPKSVNVTDLISEFSDEIIPEKLVLQRDFFRDEYAGKIDQTLTPVAECAIEFIWQKKK